MRGKADIFDFLQFGIGITPACAGKRLEKKYKEIQSEDHPRMCGEKDGRQKLVTAVKGSPPHVRGKAPAASPSLQDRRITPACAGKRLPLIFFLISTTDHPRMCGEKTAKS